MSEPTVDVRRNLRMAYQHIEICGPDETVQAALIAVEEAVAELIEALQDCVEAQQPMAQMHATERARAALARFGGAV